MRKTGRAKGGRRDRVVTSESSTEGDPIEGVPVTKQKRGTGKCGAAKGDKLPGCRVHHPAASPLNDHRQFTLLKSRPKRLFFLQFLDRHWDIPLRQQLQRCLLLSLVASVLIGLDHCFSFFSAQIMFYEKKRVVVHHLERFRLACLGSCPVTQTKFYVV